MNLNIKFDTRWLDVIVLIIVAITIFVRLNKSLTPREPIVLPILAKQSGTMCLYLGNIKGDIRLDIASGKLEHSLRLNSFEYKEHALELEVDGTQSSQLSVSYSGTIHQGKVAPQLYYGQCGLLSDKWKIRRL